MMLTGTNELHTHEPDPTKELYYWTAHVLGKPIHYGQVKFHHEGRHLMATRSVLFGIDRRCKEYVSLKTDCEKESYILNNMIVRPSG
jgi:hypothetical protein